jgi:hypothetical protein
LLYHTLQLVHLDRGGKRGGGEIEGERGRFGREK